MEKLIPESWNIPPQIIKFFWVLLALIVVVLIVRWIQRTLVVRIRDKDTRYHIRKMVTVLGYIGVLIVAALIFSEKLRGLSVAFGLAGAGIAFALQEVITSIGGWLSVTFAQFYKTGDRIKMGGITGDVIDIGVLRTTLMETGEWVDGDLYNGRVVRIANSFIFKGAVYNYSGDFPFLWDEITFPVKYGSDIKYVKERLEHLVTEIVGEYSLQAASAWKQMVKKYLVEHARTEPMITMTANENWMTFTIRYVVDYKLRRSVKNQIFERIITEVSGSDDRIKIAGASFSIEETPELKVRIQEELQGSH